MESSCWYDFLQSSASVYQTEGTTFLFFLFRIIYEGNYCANHNNKREQFTVCDHRHQLLSKAKYQTATFIGPLVKNILVLFERADNRSYLLF